MMPRMSRWAGWEGPAENESWTDTCPAHLSSHSSSLSLPTIDYQPTSCLLTKQVSGLDCWDISRKGKLRERPLP